MTSACAKKMDISRSAFSSESAACIAFAVIERAKSPRTVPGAAVIGLVALVFRELHTKEPVVDLRALRNRSFSAGVFLISLLGFVRGKRINVYANDSRIQPDGR